MSTITIDEIEYEIDDMSEEAQANLRSIQFVDAEIARLQAMIAAMNTARNAYGSTLQQLLDDEAEDS